MSLSGTDSAHVLAFRASAAKLTHALQGIFLFVGIPYLTLSAQIKSKQRKYIF